MKQSGVLSSKEILKLLKTSPPLVDAILDIEQQIQPNGIDVTVKDIAMLSSPGRISTTNESRVLSSTAPLVFDGMDRIDLLPGCYLVTCNEIVNLPNPLWFRCDIYGEKLDPVAMDMMEQSRVLDMKTGILSRKTIYVTTHHKKLEYQSKRFISMKDPHVGFMQVTVKSMDSDITLNVQTITDTSVTNKGVLTEGRKKHFQTIELSTEKDMINYHAVRTFEKLSKIYSRHGRCWQETREGEIINDSNHNRKAV